MRAKLNKGSARICLTSSGLYRGVVPQLTDDWVEHRDMTVRQL
jgi:hypothetical protein